MKQTDLRFLLKEKYKLNEQKINEILTGGNNLPNESLKDVELLRENYPVDYLIGYKPFLNCQIDLRYKTLIPRPETEYWVEKVIQDLPKSSPIRILDIFCGSGCIGISILKDLENIHCTFSDINENAIKQTKLNLELNGIPEERFEIIKSNIFENIQGKFDYIFANPPYVGTHEKVGPETKHEPMEALYADENGFGVIKNFLASTQDYLEPNGIVYMEFGQSQKNEIEEILIKNNLKGYFQKDQYGKFRFVEITQE